LGFRLIPHDRGSNKQTRLKAFEIHKKINGVGLKQVLGN